jgi:hypothetical protein
MGANLEDFLAHAKSIDWYHAGQHAGLSDILFNGMEEPTLQTPGLPSKVNNVPRLGAFGAGLNLASNIDDVKDYFEINQPSTSNPNNKPAILTAKFAGQNPLVFASYKHGVETPNFREQLLAGLDKQADKIKQRIVSGDIEDHRGDYLLEKLNGVYRGVENDSPERIGQAAPYAGFDSYITDNHQLANVGKENSLQAVVNTPRALSALRVRHGTLSEMFKGA